MKQKDIVLLSLSAALVIIGSHQTFTAGITYSYPIFMLSVALLFWYKYRQRHHDPVSPPLQKSTPTRKRAPKKTK